MSQAVSSGGERSTQAQPGRVCPVSYRYGPFSLAREPGLHADTLYIAGGVYGNPYALERILDLAHAEPAGATVVFNGDFNWFNTDGRDFARINEAVLQHTALRGNVETEIAQDEDDAGCGCAYPQEVSESEVERSNAIAARLRQTALGFPALREKIGALPMHLVAQVAGIRVGIVHGDAESLAGWSYSERALAQDKGIERLRSHIAAARVRILASSHTCLPVALGLESPEGPCALFNNGAAGMPNFRGSRFGLITRVGVHPSRHALYGTRIGGVYVQALAVDYDHARWMDAFLANWPPGSAAHESYFGRLSAGPAYELAAAARGAVAWNRRRDNMAAVIE